MQISAFFAFIRFAFLFIYLFVIVRVFRIDKDKKSVCLLQFEPERMSTQIVARILVKALMAMPAPDFSLCLFLIPERVVSFYSLFYILSFFLHLILLNLTLFQQMEEQFKTLIVLSHYLEVCFWVIR